MMWLVFAAILGCSGSEEPEPRAERAAGAKTNQYVHQDIEMPEGKAEGDLDLNGSGGTAAARPARKGPYIPVPVEPEIKPGNDGFITKGYVAPAHPSVSKTGKATEEAHQYFKEMEEEFSASTHAAPTIDGPNAKR